MSSLESLRAADVMRSDFGTINVDEPLSKALGRLEDEGVLVVLGGDGSYLGLLTERDAIRTLADPATTKVRSVYRRAPKLSPEDDVLRAARLMLENDTRYLPVVSDGRVVGVVDADDVLEVASRSKFGETKVSEVMTQDPVTISEDETVARALALMRKEGVSRLPVLRGDRVVGMLTIRDVLEKVVRPRAGGQGSLRRRVSEAMSRDLVTVLPGDTVRRAVELMRGRNVASVLVVDEDGRLRGILTRSDLLRELARLRKEEPQVVVQLSVKDPEDFENVEVDREKLNAMIGGFLRKYGGFLGPARATLYIKRHKEKRRGRRLTHCRFIVDSPRGVFVGVGEGWGLVQAARNAIDSAARQVERAKEGKGADRALVEEILEML